MGRTVGGIINGIYSQLRLAAKKPGRNICFHGVQHIDASAQLTFDKGASVTLREGVYLRKDCALKIRNGAKLFLGKGVMLNNQCIIGCHERVEIGDGTAFGPGVYVYDHDHDYRQGLNSGKYLTSPVVIGKNCWIGAGTIILRGTVLGDNCVVGAGSILNGSYPADSLILQKRETTVRVISAN